jgi:hypothetical protein
MNPYDAHPIKPTDQDPRHMRVGQILRPVIYGYVAVAAGLMAWAIIPQITRPRSCRSWQK